jgi:hypothetical protein
MSTPEQLTLIRHAIHYRELRYADKERELTDALIALYADAERFQALERASPVEQVDVEEGVIVSAYEVHREGSYETLAELADKLRSEK